MSRCFFQFTADFQLNDRIVLWTLFPRPRSDKLGDSAYEVTVMRALNGSDLMVKGKELLERYFSSIISPRAFFIQSAVETNSRFLCFACHAL